MIESVISFLVARYLFFNQGSIVFFTFLILSFILSLKRKFFCRIAILALIFYALEQALFFPLSSLIQDCFKNLSYPCGIAELSIAAIAGMTSVLVSKQTIKTTHLEHLLIISIFFLCAINADSFTFSRILFSLELIIVLVGARLLIYRNFEIIHTTKFKIIIIFTLLLGSSVFTYTINQDKPVNILVVQEKNAWAKDEIPYDTSDWTLKSSYSYSLLYELMSHRYNVAKTSVLSTANFTDIDVLFFMTPTKPFPENEKAILNNFLSNGGKIIFIADHTDLYGHARAINSFIEPHGIRVRDDAVFDPSNKHAKALMINYLQPKVRMMTSSSLGIDFNTAILAFCNNFVSENADYTRANFFAEMRASADDRFGSFPLVTATAVGSGTIIVCAESTIFSNFAIFQPNVLELLDLLFKQNEFTARLSAMSIIFLAIAILLLCIQSQKKEFAIYASIILLLITTRSFFFYTNDVLEFYEESKILFVKSDDKYIYEPDFKHMNKYANSCSYLLSAIPRYGIYPYFIDKFSFISSQDIDLFIGDTSLATKLASSQKLLSINSYETHNSSVVAIPDNFSDEKLGDWWAQIDVSPYRKNRVESFSKWLKLNQPIPKFHYPKYDTCNSKVTIKLKNDAGNEKIVELSYEALQATPEGGYILIDDGIWGLKSKVGEDLVIVGGDSLNDRRKADFFSRYWFGTIPDLNVQE